VGGRATLDRAQSSVPSLSTGSKSWLTVSFPEYWLYFLGALFIVVTLYMPQGVVGLVRKLRGARA